MKYVHYRVVPVGPHRQEHPPHRVRDLRRQHGPLRQPQLRLRSFLSAEKRLHRHKSGQFYLVERSAALACLYSHVMRDVPAGAVSGQETPLYICVGRQDVVGSVVDESQGVEAVVVLAGVLVLRRRR